MMKCLFCGHDYVWVSTLTATTRNSLHERISDFDRIEVKIKCTKCGKIKIIKYKKKELTNN